MQFVPTPDVGESTLEPPLQVSELSTLRVPAWCVMNLFAAVLDFCFTVALPSLLLHVVMPFRCSDERGGRSTTQAAKRS